MMDITTEPSDIIKWLRNRKNIIVISNPRLRLVSFVDIESPNHDNIICDILKNRNKKIYKIWQKHQCDKGVMYAERGMMFADWVEKILYKDIFPT
jgi:hypothetical protein